MTLKYTTDHEWVRLEGEEATVGISSHATGQLGDVVFVELPGIGAVFRAGDEMAVVESVKAASDVYAPVSGEIIAVNTAITETPAKLNEDPMGAAWFAKMKPADLSELERLMDEAAYQTHIGEG